jgi:hypothetical protein
MRDLTEKEAHAIIALKRVAERWPKTLMLVHYGCGGGDLSVLDRNGAANLTLEDSFAIIRGFHASSAA